MSRKIIEEQLQKIRDAAAEGYDGEAHGAEKWLLQEFANFVAEYSTDTEVAEMASLVLTCVDIDFSRWYE